VRSSHLYGNKDPRVAIKATLHTSLANLMSYPFDDVHLTVIIPNAKELGHLRRPQLSMSIFDF
jgi:hypothetical protein